MINCLIFSRDRACQLDALLQTIDRYAPMLKPTVLFRASNRDFAEAYDLIWRPGMFRDDLRTLEPFAWWVRTLVKGFGDTVCFLVDDDLFYADACEPGALPWSWRAADYDYPFSLDGCVYERDRILPLLNFDFHDPTQLEAGVAWRLANNPAESWLLAHGEPCLVGVPHNRVSPSSGMPTLGGTAAELNERFLAGERIDPFATMAGVEVTETHIDVGYVWKER